MVKTAPYRIETPRLVIRCYAPDDAQRLKECMDSSLPELQERMPWALADPQPVEEKVQLLRGMRAQFDTDADYVMGIFDQAGTRQLGGTGLHPRDSAALAIGYYIRTDSTGQGLARESTGVLVDVGLRVMGADRIEIMVEPDNTPSLAIPRGLGFVEEGLLRGRCEWPGRAPRDVIMFSMFPDTWDPERASSYRAFDAQGRLIQP